MLWAWDGTLERIRSVLYWFASFSFLRRHFFSAT